MSDVFISYARSSEVQAEQVELALRDAGYNVWRDVELPAHRTYADVIEERLKLAKAVVVLWSVKATKSQWVRAEADAARELGTLIQASIDGSIPPIPFNQIQCADLKGWSGSTDHVGWRKLAASVTALAGGSDEPEQLPNPRRQKTSVCVLPFANMSGDAEQEYFSDGISEDITTDLSKVSALEVIARNTAFMFKGQSVDVTDIARKLSVSHVLEGSVRKAGNRVRITAQLIDGRTGGHVWADRYDRDLTDIFAIQDEISKAIVATLQLKLLPAEKKAIEHRGTSNTEAYELYLMARQFWASGNDGDPRKHQVILRLTRNAVELDPNYARAWALMALAQGEMSHRGIHQDGMATAEKALQLDSSLPEPHCVKAGYFARKGEHDKANAEIERALQLDPDSWEAAKEAGFIRYRQGRIDEALRHFERAVALMETDIRSAMMLAGAYQARGEADSAAHYARIAVERVERVIEQDRSNGSALAYGAVALAALGETDRAKEWMRRALFIDPDNLIMRYNLACACAQSFNDAQGALDLLQPYLEKVSPAQLRHVEVDPSMDPLRDHPRFRSMVLDAKKRLAV